MKKRPFLSVVIPSYNEMANLQKGTLTKVKHFLTNQEFTYEVIVVDDGSTDGSLEYVQKFAKEHKSFRVIENHHTGKAGAVTNGMLKANGEYVLFTDMDQATPIEEIKKFLPHLEDGYDVVIGSRSERKGAPISRKIMSKSAITLRKLIVGIPEVEDTQCGFKVFSRKAAQDIFKKLKKIHNGFKEIKGSSVTSGFDVEILYLAKQGKYKIKEVPVHWLYVETRRVNPLNDSINGVKDLIKIRYNMMSGVYK